MQRRGIDFDRLDAIVSKFAASSKYAKPKAPKKVEKPKDPLLLKHEKEQRWLKQLKERRDYKRQKLSETYPAFRRWVTFIEGEIKAKECWIDEYGLLDTDYITEAQRLKLHKLPADARNEAKWVFSDLIDSVMKRVKKSPDYDPLACFDHPRPPGVKLDFDEMAHFLETGC